MNIKRLEIFGFKSFKNKTVLEFSRNLTAVAGPNGCGKSNIADALLWAMGESSAKNLRGGSNADVIFKGTDRLPPASFAEVSLLLEKGASGFSGKYKDFSELMITRRAERDGLSECFINREPCRLKDIRELFMDTGAGCRGFSVIEQESAGKLVTVKPRERRLILEEAAGISKFKSRKEESFRKLDQVTENLQRLEDILKTQRADLSRLSRQAKAAEKYRNLKRELRDREKEALFRQIEKSEGQAASFESALLRLKKEERALKTSKTALESRLRLTERDLKRSESLLEREKKYLLELDLKIREIQKEEESAVSAKRLSEENLKNHLLFKEALSKDIEEIRLKIKALKSGFPALQIEENRLKGELQSLKAGFQETENLPDLRAGKEALNRDLESLRAEKAERDLQAGVLRSQKEFLMQEREAVLLKKQRAEQKFTESLKEKTRKAAHIAKYRDLQEGAEREKTFSLKKIQTLEKKKQILEKELSGFEREAALLSYKIEEAARFVNHFESPNEGSSRLLKWRPQSFRPLIKSLVTEPGFESAAEAVLDRFLYTLSSDGESSVREGVDWLKQTKKGRASFLLPPLEDESGDWTSGGFASGDWPRAALSGGGPAPRCDASGGSNLGGAGAKTSAAASFRRMLRDLQACPAFIGFLDEKISFSASLPAAESLLRAARRTAVVSDFYSALEMRARFPGFQFVTKEGDFISRDNILSGGSYENKTNIFKIKNQTDQLKNDLNGVQTALALKKTGLLRIVQSLKGLVAELRAAERREKEILNHIQSLQREEEVLKTEMLRGTEEKESFEKAESAFQKKEHEAARRFVQAQKQAKKTEEAIVTKENILSHTEKRLTRLESLPSGRRRLETALLKLQTEKEMRERESAALQDFLGRSLNRRAEVLQTEEKLKTAIEEAGRRRRERAKERALHEEEKAQAAFKRESGEKQALEVKEKLAAVRREADAKEEEREGIKEKAYDLSLQKERLNLQKQSGAEQFLKEFGMNWKDCVPQYEALSDEELQKEAVSLEREIDKAGEVNLIALKEYESLLKDNLFLNEQREDLLGSKKKLLKIISHVDSLCRKRFESRLEEINIRFSRVFPLVFGGASGAGDSPSKANGEARLVLIKEEVSGPSSGGLASSPADSGSADGGEEPGVDIIVRPPGKKLQNINLLSRGEKALTALCLVYSLFLVKPSPFCVLDEADASLDDANSFRFLSVLRQMAQRSRIIAVTHNKRTMEAADRLYGVTMAEPGVSQVVSLDLGKSGEKSLASPAG